MNKIILDNPKFDLWQEDMIPDRLKEVDVAPCRCSAVYHGKKGFVGKTIEGIFDIGGPEIYRGLFFQYDL